MIARLEDPRTTTGHEIRSGEKLRVLHLVPTFTGGGAERQLAYLARELAELGLDIHVGYLRDGPNLKLLEGTSVTLHRLPVSGSHDLRLPWLLRRLLRDVKPHVVQTWLPQMDVLGGLLARLAAIAWVLSERSASAAYLSGWKIRARKIIGRRATAIVANSSEGLEYWRDASSSTIRRTIRNIVPLEAIADSAFAPQERFERLPAGARLIVAAGRLQAEKNWEVFIDALNIALGTLPDVHAVIFGDGTLRHSLQERIARSPFANRIRLNGYTDDLWKWLNLASCYVSVSHFEGSPNVVLEALACQLPIVVSDIPAHRELLSESSAEFVSPHSAEAVASAVIKVFNDDETMTRRAHDSLRVVRQWSGGAIASAYVDLYLEISRQSKRPRTE